MTKKFEDLTFEVRNDIFGGSHALMNFENGYGVSVIFGGGAYGSGSQPYELAVLDENGLCYDTPITDDVLGHLSPADVTKHMASVQALPAKAAS